MGGTALSAFFTPRFVTWFGYIATHVIIAPSRSSSAVIVWFGDARLAGWRPNTDPVVPKLAAALRLPVTWQMSFLYAVTFGGFVAFSTYLPTYLKDVYYFDLTEAGTRTAGFAIAAVVARPIGGILSDRIGPRRWWPISLAGAAVLAIVRRPRAAARGAGRLAFVAMAFFLGLGTGGVFAWVAQRGPPSGSAASPGIVGAAGGLGGFFPPLVSRIPMRPSANIAGRSPSSAGTSRAVQSCPAVAWPVLVRLADPRQEPSC